MPPPEPAPTVGASPTAPAPPAGKPPPKYLEASEEKLNSILDYSYGMRSIASVATKLWLALPGEPLGGPPGNADLPRAHVYAARGDIGSLQALLRAQGPDAISDTLRDPRGRSPLDMAALGGSIDTVKWLLEHTDVPDPAKPARPTCRKELRGATTITSMFFRRVDLASLAASKGHLKMLLWVLDELKVPAEKPTSKDADKPIRALDMICWDVRSPIHWAAASGSIDCVKVLLARGASPSRLALGTPLHWAALSGSLPLVKLLLNTKDAGTLQPPVLDKQGRSVVVWAAMAPTPDVLKFIVAETGKPITDPAIYVNDKGGDTLLHFVSTVPTAQWLLEEGKLNINDADEFGVPPFLSVLARGLAPLAMWMVDSAGADPKAKTINHSDALTAAIEGGSLAAVEWLVEKHGYSPNQPRGPRNVTAMSTAAYQGQLEIMKTLKSKYGAPLDGKQDLSGNSPLMLAALQKHLHVVDYLLEQSVNLEDKNNAGENALMFAIKSHNRLMIERLVAHGADVNAALGSSGLTCFITAIISGQPDIAQYLVDKGARITMKDTLMRFAAVSDSVATLEYVMQPEILGGSPHVYADNTLMYAVDEGAKETAKFLLDFGVSSLDYRTTDGCTILAQSVRRCDLEMAKMLMEYPDVCRIVNQGSVCAMSWAATVGSVEALEALKAIGGKVDIATMGGTTPLHYAARNGQKDAVDWLLKNGANLGAENLQGATAADEAAAVGQEDIALHLRKLEKSTGVSKARGKADLARRGGLFGILSGKSRRAEKKAAKKLGGPPVGSRGVPGKPVLPYAQAKKVTTPPAEGPFAIWPTSELRKDPLYSKVPKKAAAVTPSPAAGSAVATSTTEDPKKLVGDSV